MPTELLPKGSAAALTVSSVTMRLPTLSTMVRGELLATSPANVRVFHARALNCLSVVEIGKHWGRRSEQRRKKSFRRNLEENHPEENGISNRQKTVTINLPLTRVRDPNAATILGLLHLMSLTLFMAWTKTQKSKRDQTYPTWQSRLEGKRWWIIRQVTESPG